MSADEILKLIETVDPSDTAKLDEIDVRVFAFVENLRIGFKWGRPILQPKWSGEWFYNLGEGKQYTRSRDALKAIRPEGWEYACSFTAGKWAELWKKDNTWRCVANDLPTEELAELHAIIQAIEYERTNK